MQTACRDTASLLGDAFAEELRNIAEEKCSKFCFFLVDLVLPPTLLA